jgi:hypothetical protein
MAMDKEDREFGSSMLVAVVLIIALASVGSCVKHCSSARTERCKAALQDGTLTPEQKALICGRGDGM